MLQNATLLRKSAPWPPNISDEHVSCTALATRHASLQILFKCPTPAMVFWKCYNPLAACSLLTRCTIPCACHAKRHLNVQKCSVPVSFEHLWLRNVLRAATACTFSTSQPPKVVWDRQFFKLLTSMCFAPKRRALFHHLNFQRWSETVSFFFALLTSKCASKRLTVTVANGCGRLRPQTQRRANTPSTPRPPEWNGDPCYAFGNITFGFFCNQTAFFLTERDCHNSCSQMFMYFCLLTEDQCVPHSTHSNAFDMNLLEPRHLSLRGQRWCWTKSIGATICKICADRKVCSLNCLICMGLSEHRIP